MFQYADICWVIYYYCYLLTCSKEKRLIVIIFIFTNFAAASITMNVSIQLILFFLESSPVVPPIFQILTFSNTDHQHVILSQLHNINLCRIILLTKILFHTDKSLIKIWIKPSFIFLSIHLNITTKLCHEIPFECWRKNRFAWTFYLFNYLCTIFLFLYLLTDFLKFLSVLCHAAIHLILHFLW